MAKRSAKKTVGTKTKKKAKPHANSKKSGLPHTIEVLERVLRATLDEDPTVEEAISATAITRSSRAAGDPTVAVIWQRIRDIFGSKVLGDTELEPLLRRENITRRALPNHINQSDGFQEEGLHLVYADIANAVYLADIGVAIATWYRKH